MTKGQKQRSRSRSQRIKVLILQISIQSAGFISSFPCRDPGAIQAHTKLRWMGLKRLENPCKRNSSEAQS